MPLPFIIGGIAAVAGVAGIGSGIHGGVKMKEANDTMELAKRMQKRALNLFERENKATTALMDELGKQELSILASFDDFSDTIERIQNRPIFKAYHRDGVDLPEYESEELKNISTAAGVLLGGIGGAAAGTAGGIAASGAATTAVMALGTASTGTAISTLSGVAATNATLAALGGGSLAAGGGGMALGSAVLAGATLGVGLLVGGMIFNMTGNALSEKADEAYDQACKTEYEVSIILDYFDELTEAATSFRTSLTQVEEIYKLHLSALKHIVFFQEKTDWFEFSDKEKKYVENSILLVGLLYSMCKVNLVIKQESEDEMNKVNHDGVDNSVQNAKQLLSTIEP